jgi:hypothetical protein
MQMYVAIEGIMSLLPASGIVALQVSPASPRFSVARTLKVELKNPNIVIGPDGHQGTWTTVYDEAFEISLDNWRVGPTYLAATV